MKRKGRCDEEKEEGERASVDRSKGVSSLQQGDEDEDVGTATGCEAKTTVRSGGTRTKRTFRRTHAISETCLP